METHYFILLVRIPDVQAGFIKGRRIRDQIANICWIIKKQESFRKTSTFALLPMPKPSTVWITINWKILQEMGKPDHHGVFIIGPVKIPVKIVSKSFFPFVIGMFSSCIFCNF